MYHVVFCTVLQNAMARYEVNHKFVILWQFSKKSLIAGRSNYGQRRAQGRPGPHGRRLKQPPPPPLVYAKAPPLPSKSTPPLPTYYPTTPSPLAQLSVSSCAKRVQQFYAKDECLDFFGESWNGMSWRKLGSEIYKYLLNMITYLLHPCAYFWPKAELQHFQR